ncbi:MAG: hypothetical protein AB1656_24375 [Candidatus Omnitrophota bacterium]
MPKTESKKQAVLTGVVTAAEWDENGNVVGVILATEDESEYRIANSPQGKKLFNLLQHQIRATGIVGEDKSGKKTLLVSQFQVLQQW